ncbi:putative vacuolar membrane transporter [Gnomoniopsis sp. IMI 355080]|nr:putative vacuolar membrane transporter [Gnomoniopsis sp. IMI 355080]
MAPSTAPLNLDVEAISGICGSISIACWVVVFSPQIIENFQRGSANGLSLQFIIVWLLGDIFNILGAVLQGVLPTMLILAIYYTIADIVLLGQMFYYRGITWKDEVVPPTPKKRRRSGVHGTNGAGNGNGTGHPAAAVDERTSLLGERERRGSDWSDRLSHLNPANPVIEAAPPPPPSTTLHSAAWNTTCVLMVIAAGVLGWWLSRSYGPADDDDNNNKTPDSGSSEDIHFDLGGQIFGWLCAVFYLGSRLPQLLLNFRRKSTEGVSMLFFLFACLGNLTYVLSIFAFDPKCSDADSHCKPGEAGRIYGQYILVNLSWLAGSLGTLLLDMGIFIQFFVYADNETGQEDDSAILEDGDEDDERSIDGERWDQRPILERSHSVESD